MFYLKILIITIKCYRICCISLYFNRICSSFMSPIYNFFCSVKIHIMISRHFCHNICMTAIRNNFVSYLYFLSHFIYLTPYFKCLFNDLPFPKVPVFSQQLTILYFFLNYIQIQFPLFSHLLEF